MTRIALTAAATLLAVGTAFAGSDHYNADNADQPTTSVDGVTTASVAKRGLAKPTDVEATMTTGPAGSKAWPDPGQGIWGN